MSHYITARGQEDQTRIDAQQEADIHHWSRAFSLAPHELRAAMRVVGPIAADVERYINAQRR